MMVHNELAKPMTIDSFHKYNPDWEIIITTKQSPPEMGKNTFAQIIQGSGLIP